MDILPEYSFDQRPRWWDSIVLRDGASPAVASCGRTAVTSFGDLSSDVYVSLGQVMTKVPPSQDL